MSPTFDVTLALMLFRIIYIALAALKFGKSKPVGSFVWTLAYKLPPLSFKKLSFMLLTDDDVNLTKLLRHGKIDFLCQYLTVCRHFFVTPLSEVSIFVAVKKLKLFS